MDAGKHGSFLFTTPLCFRPASAILTTLPTSCLHLLCWPSSRLAVQLQRDLKESRRTQEFRFNKSFVIKKLGGGCKNMY